MENFNVSVNQIKSEDNSLVKSQHDFLNSISFPPLTWNASWAFCSLPLICLLNLTPILYCCSYYRFKIYLFIFDMTSIRGCSNLVFFFSPPNFLMYFFTFIHPDQCQIYFINFNSKTQFRFWLQLWKIYGEFEEDWHLYNIKSSCLKTKYGPLFIRIVQ